MNSDQLIEAAIAFVGDGTRFRTMSKKQLDEAAFYLQGIIRDYQQTSGDPEWKQNKVIMLITPIVQGIEAQKLHRDAEIAEAAAVKAERECEPGREYTESSSGIFGSRNSDYQKSQSGVCAKCDGKGWVMDHNPLGTTKSSEMKGYSNKSRGWLDMLIYGGGNRKDCPVCKGTGIK